MNRKILKKSGAVLKIKIMALMFVLSSSMMAQTAKIKIDIDRTIG